MKITKTKLKRLIRETLSEALPDVSAASEEAPQPKQAADVERVGKKLGQVSGLEGILANINSRVEFEQVLMQFIQLTAKEKLKSQDVKVGVRNVAKQILKGK